MARAFTQALISTQSATRSFVRFSGAFTRRLNRLPDRVYCNCRGRPLSDGFLFLWASNTLTEHYPLLLDLDSLLHGEYNVFARRCPVSAMGLQTQEVILVCPNRKPQVFRI